MMMMMWKKRSNRTRETSSTCPCTGCCSGSGYGVDRISYLPDTVHLKILSSLDTKYAVQSSLLSKRWKNLWTTLADLNFDRNSFESLPDFHEFVRQVLARRDGTIKINNLNFRQPGKLDSQILETITQYAFSHNVQHLNVSLKSKERNTFPPFPISSDSLRSLNLKNLGFKTIRLLSFPATRMRKSDFKQLVSLHLENIALDESDTFSGFPNLKDLVLINSIYLQASLFKLNIISPTLSTLTLVFDNMRLLRTEIVVSTPKLSSLKAKRYSIHRGAPFLLVNASQGLPVLNSVTLDVNDCSDDLISLLEWVGNARSVALSSSMVELLSSAAPEKLAQNPSPFANLKTLKFIHFSRDMPVKVPVHVMTYLLRNTSCENVVMEVNSQV